ncbi:hypothetical protein C8R47DRAFT_1215570 [Mycena vitilis]|nr:hypothetical protein C8R47DRAFT_1215570 [Mycena vitilis]
MDNLVDDVLDRILSDAIGDVNEWECAVSTRRVVSAVCKGWTVRVVTNPTFWKKIWIYRFTPSTFVKFCLKNSKGQASILYVNGNLYESIRPPGLPRTVRKVQCRPLEEHLQLLDDVLRCNIAQVSQLVIAAESPQDWERIARALPIPTLSCVNKVVATSRATEEWHPLPAPLTEIKDDGKERWHCVTTMLLDGIHPLWAAPATTPNLTHLSVRNVSGLAMEQLLQGLRQAPQLTFLQLQDVVCHRVDAAQGVVMNCLTEFSLGYREDAGVFIVEHIAMPALRRIKLDVGDNATLDVLINVAPTQLSTVVEVDIAVRGMAKGNLPWILAAMENAEVVDMRRCGSGSMAAVHIAAQWNTHLMRRLRVLKTIDEIEAPEADALFSVLRRHPPIRLFTGLRDPDTLDEYVEWTDSKHGAVGIRVALGGRGAH